MVWSLQVTPELSDRQFDEWSKLLEERTGIQVASQQRVFLQTQISIRMREVGHSSYDQYFRQLTEGVKGKIEWSMLVDRLVVKETSFFRHRPSIDYASRLLQDRINSKTLTDSFDIWSVGCASGEEPYSLAMAINDRFESAGLDPYYGIVATDISLPALNFARVGVYLPRKLEHIKPVELERYFQPAEKGCYLIDEVVRKRVCFTRGNVLNIGEMPAVKMDIIFSQNLLVYFRRWRRREILNAFVERLKPGGVLIIGLGEVVDWEHQRVQRVSDDSLQAYIRR